MYTLFLCLTVAAPAPKKEAPAILGTWIVESVISFGKPQEQPEALRWTFTEDGKCISREGKGNEQSVSIYKLNSEKSPAYFDITPGFPGSDKPAEGIYKIEGDVLTVCFAIKGRPTRFVSTNETTNVLITLKRAKKE